MLWRTAWQRLPTGLDGGMAWCRGVKAERIGGRPGYAQIVENVETPPEP